MRTQAVDRPLRMALLLVALVGGCERRPSEPIAGSGPARRIVSTMPSTTEMLDRLGVFDRVVGVSIFCDTPPEARSRTVIGSGMDPDLEQMLVLRPDLVVGTVAQDGYAFLTSLEGAGVRVLLVDDRSLDAFYEGYRELGRAVGALPAAEREVAQIRGELAAVQAAVAGRPRPRVMIVYDHDPVYAAGPETLIDALIELAGGINAVPHGDWVALDREQVIQLAPEVILEPGDAAPDDLRAAWAALQTIPAVRDGRIGRLSARGVSRPGIGSPEVVRELARQLHPGAFPP